MTHSRLTLPSGLALAAMLLVLGADGATRQGPRAAAPAVSLSWLEAQLAREEYRPRPHGEAWQAPNRASDWRLRWDDEVVRIERSESREVIATLRTAWVGRDEATGEVLAPRRPVASATARERLERRWPALTEWFVNDRAGLEQGWTVEAPPPGAGPVRIRVLVAEASVTLLDPATARLESRGGPPLTYGGLAAFDADGRPVPAWFERHASGLDVRVDDRQARYPLTVDPKVTPVETGSTVVADGRLGTSVAQAGDVNGDGFGDVVVGAPGYDAGNGNVGAAFLFLGSAGGLKAPQLVGLGPGIDSGFGRALAVGHFSTRDALELAVSAPELDQVTFFKWDAANGAFVLTMVLSPTGAVGSRFGTSLANLGDFNGDGLGDDLAVGAPDFDHPGNPNLIREGRVFVFSGASLGGFPLPFAFFDIDAPGAHLGASVAGVGDLNRDGRADLLAGAPDFDPVGSGGRAVFALGVASAPTTTLPAARTTVGGQPYARFGASVAAVGDANGDGRPDLVVGAPGLRDLNSQQVGAVLFFSGELGSAPTQPPFFGSLPFGNLGASVAAAGDVNGDGFADVVAGAPATTSLPGYSRVFFGGPRGLGRPSTQDGSNAGDEFGASVAGAGDINGDGFSDVVIGAPGREAQASPQGPVLPNAGGIGLALGSAAGLQTAGLVHDGAQTLASLGRALASGDVNGDGLTDMLIGAPGHDQERGEVRLRFGPGLDNPQTVAWLVKGEHPFASFGASVSSAGDVNGDGYADVIVGSPGASVDPAARSSEGRAYLFLGRPQGPSGSPSWTATGTAGKALFGASVASGCDVNGDGYADVVVGAPGVVQGGVSEAGAVYVYQGHSGGLADEPWVLPFPSAPGVASFGSAVACAGDFDSDGYSDIVVAAERLLDSAVLGRAWVYFGRGDGPPVRSRGFGGTADEEGLGVSVAGAGDVNADGYSDFVVGAVPRPDAGAVAKVFVYFGAQGLPLPARWSLPAPRATGFGTSVAGAGDVNGDGFSDVLIGAPDYAVSAGNVTGGAALFQGGLVPPATTPDAGTTWAVTGPSSSGFGAACATAGDVNGDGFSDVLVGAPNATPQSSAEGAGQATLFLGGDREPGRPYQLVQSLDGSPRGAGYHATGGPLTVTAALRDELAGRSALGIEMEVKRVAQPFDGTGLRRATAAANGAVTVTTPVLLPGRYHWRVRLTVNGLRGRWRAYGGNDETEADFVWGMPIVTILPDAGVVDAGVLPVDDGGVLADGGQPGADGGAGPMDFTTSGCNCSGAAAEPVLFALGLWLVQRARRRRGA